MGKDDQTPWVIHNAEHHSESIVLPGQRTVKSIPGTKYSFHHSFAKGARVQFDVVTRCLIVPDVIVLDHLGAAFKLYPLGC